jgi:hypothetical protein
MAQDKPPATINQNVTSHNQSGGITAHTVNIGPQRRDLNSPWGAPLKAQILDKIPRDKEIGIVAVMGDVECYELGMQLHTFLKANGYRLKESDGISQGVFMPPPRNVNFNPDTNEFQIGPSG